KCDDTLCRDLGNARVNEINRRAQEFTDAGLARIAYWLDMVSPTELGELRATFKRRTGERRA
ncbi:MAG: hypothetical protein AAFX05_04360, partial [Planctomycetota bacterium]